MQPLDSMMPLAIPATVFRGSQMDHPDLCMIRYQSWFGTAAEKLMDDAVSGLPMSCAIAIQGIALVCLGDIAGHHHVAFNIKQRGEGLAA